MAKGCRCGRQSGAQAKRGARAGVCLYAGVDVDGVACAQQVPAEEHQHLPRRSHLPHLPHLLHLVSNHTRHGVGERETLNDPSSTGALASAPRPKPRDHGPAISAIGFPLTDVLAAPGILGQPCSRRGPCVCCLCLRVECLRLDCIGIYSPWHSASSAGQGGLWPAPMASVHVSARATHALPPVRLRARLRALPPSRAHSGASHRPPTTGRLPASACST